MFEITEWAIKHHVSMQALAELFAAFGHVPGLTSGLSTGDSETRVQGQVRMAAAVEGFTLFRNNSGALKDAGGRLVRYGLANDSAALNKVVKSSDLIGWHSETWLHPETFQPTKLARFTAIECKHADWPGYNPQDEHEHAQQRFLEMVVAAGGLARFSTGELPK